MCLISETKESCFAIKSAYLHDMAVRGKVTKSLSIQGHNLWETDIRLYSAIATIYAIKNEV